MPSNKSTYILTTSALLLLKRCRKKPKKFQIFYIKFNFPWSTQSKHTTTETWGQSCIGKTFVLQWRDMKFIVHIGDAASIILFFKLLGIVSIVFACSPLALNVKIYSRPAKSYPPIASLNSNIPREKKYTTQLTFECILSHTKIKSDVNGEVPKKIISMPAPLWRMCIYVWDASRNRLIVIHLSPPIRARQKTPISI